MIMWAIYMYTCSRSLGRSRASSIYIWVWNVCPDQLQEKTEAEVGIPRPLCHVTTYKWVWFSVQLARRVLQLERINSSLREELRWEGERLGRVQEELEQCRELVRCSQQPGGFLLERLKDQQEKLQHNSGMVRNMEGEVAALRDENTKLKDTKNKMSVDLERLLSHREVSGFS